MFYFRCFYMSFFNNLHPSRSLIVYILWPTNTGGFLDPNRRISSLGRLTKTSSASPTPNATTNSAVQKGQLSVTPTASLSLSKPSVRLAYAGTSSSLKLYLKQNRLKSNVRLTLRVLHPHEYAIRLELVSGKVCVESDLRLTSYVASVMRGNVRDAYPWR